MKHPDHHTVDTSPKPYETNYGKVWGFEHDERGFIHGRLPTSEEEMRLGYSHNNFWIPGALIVVAKHESGKFIVLCQEDGELIGHLEELKG